ncbi:MAG: helix-turn-helix domain-containing protein, partial [Gorillibacterium sp.]|nr:helix-turn-helix domain-containing protein [Gorillibacterium sp.]
FKILFDPDKPYVMASLRIDKYVEFTRTYNMHDQNLFRYAVINVTNEIFARSLPCEVVSMDNDMFIIMFNDRGQPYGVLQKTIYDLLEDTQDWVTVNLRLSLSGVFSYIGSGLQSINHSYQEIMNLSKYRLIFGLGTVVSPDSLLQQIHEPLKWSSIREKKLLDALSDGNPEEAVLYYKEIIGELKEYTYDTIMSTLLYMTYAVYNLLNMMESNSLNRFDVDFSTFTNRIHQAETLEQVDEGFEQMFTHVSSVIVQRRGNRSSVVAETVMKLIDANYADKGLCLESVASSINMSKVYVGKLFRDTYGYSVADYITEVRLNKTVELLKAGRLHLSDVLNEVGIENKTYFYKLFKTKMGVSFSDFKLKYLHNIVDEEPEKL